MEHFCAEVTECRILPNAESATSVEFANAECRVCRLSSLPSAKFADCQVFQVRILISAEFVACRVCRVPNLSSDEFAECAEIVECADLSSLPSAEIADYRFYRVGLYSMYLSECRVKGGKTPTLSKICYKIYPFRF